MNWMSKNPLPITFANYLVDSRIAEAARRFFWLDALYLFFISVCFIFNMDRRRRRTKPILKTLSKSRKKHKKMRSHSFQRRLPLALRFVLSRPFCLWTSKRVLIIIDREVTLLTSLDEVAYITQAGDKYLDDETLHRTKIFVVHAFPEVNFPPMCRDTLLKSLEAENIETYRLPLDANVK